MGGKCQLASKFFSSTGDISAFGHASFLFNGDHDSFTHQRDCIPCPQLHALTKNIAIELGANGIRVNAVSPAVVQTPIYEGFIPKDEVNGVMAGRNAG